MRLVISLLLSLGLATTALADGPSLNCVFHSDEVVDSSEDGLSIVFLEYFLDFPKQEVTAVGELECFNIFGGHVASQEVKVVMSGVAVDALKILRKKASKSCGFSLGIGVEKPEQALGTYVAASANATALVVGAQSTVYTKADDESISAKVALLVDNSKGLGATASFGTLEISAVEQLEPPVEPEPVEPDPVEPPPAPPVEPDPTEGH